MRRHRSCAIPSTLRCLVDSTDELGEGPCWAEAEQRLYWADILRSRLLWLEPASGATGEFALPMCATALAPHAGGGLLAATDTGLVRIDTATGATTIIKRFRFRKGFRTNDGNIDPLGRFWWSTMDAAGGGKRRGHVYVTFPDGRTTRRLGGIAIANTLVCSPDGSTLYLADSGRKTLTAYDINPRSAALKKPKLLAQTTGAATPDGSAMDAEGFLWNAQWDAWRIVRYAPDGRIDRIVETPVSRPTSCAFGGPGLATLYVTSARTGLSAEELEREPLAGGLFAFEPGVAGLPLPAFGT